MAMTCLVRVCSASAFKSIKTLSYFRFCRFYSEDDSPYLEVRSAVANFDDPEMPASTIRAWTLGIIWAILLSGMNQFFYFRYPSVAIGNVRSKMSLWNEIRNNR